MKLKVVYNLLLIYLLNLIIYSCSQEAALTEPFNPAAVTSDDIVFSVSDDTVKTGKPFNIRLKIKGAESYIKFISVVIASESRFSSQEDIVGNDVDLILQFNEKSGFFESSCEIPTHQFNQKIETGLWKVYYFSISLKNNNFYTYKFYHPVSMTHYAVYEKEIYPPTQCSSIAIINAFNVKEK